MPPIYGLTPRRAVQVKQLCEDGGSTSGGSPLPTATRGPTWVKVTGSPTAGWHPGVVSLDQAGTFTDLTTVVKVAAADGSTLTTGNRYPCTRTGDADDGTARFRTLPDDGVPTACQGAVGAINVGSGTGDASATTSVGAMVGAANWGITLNVPAAGWYMLGGTFRTYGNSFNSSLVMSARAVIVDCATGSPLYVAGYGWSELLELHLFRGTYLFDFDNQQTVSFSTLWQASGPTTLRLRVTGNAHTGTPAPWWAVSTVGWLNWVRVRPPAGGTVDCY